MKVKFYVNIPKIHKTHYNSNLNSIHLIPLKKRKKNKQNGHGEFFSDSLFGPNCHFTRAWIKIRSQKEKQKISEDDDGKNRRKVEYTTLQVVEKNEEISNHSNEANRRETKNVIKSIQQWHTNFH